MKDSKNSFFDFFKGKGGGCGCGGGIVLEDDDDKNESASNEKDSLRDDKERKEPVNKGCC
jgi:hypothetical protein